MFWGNEVEITESNTIKPHKHAMWELVVCLSSTGRHVINGRTFAFTPGRTFLLPSNVSHQALGTVVEPARIFYLCFDLQVDSAHIPPALAISLRKAAERRLFASNPSGAGDENMEAARSMAEELRGGRVLSQAVIGALLARVVLNHLRSFQAVPDGDREDVGRIAAVISSIHKNPRARRSLDETAKRAGMSRGKFTREFRRVTGMSFVEYINSVRIGNAIDLLTNSDKPVHIVAAECGFDNLGYFHRMFKRHCNSTPKRLRRFAKETGQVPLR